MSKSNCIPVFDVGNNIISSGITIAGLGGGLSATSGSFTHADNDTTNTVITHNLGKIPTNITFYTTYAAASAHIVLNTATYNSSGNTGSYITFQLSSGSQQQQGTGENFVVKVFSYGVGNSLIGTVSAINSTTFTISWSLSGSFGGNTILTMWNATG